MNHIFRREQQGLVSSFVSCAHVLLPLKNEVQTNNGGCLLFEKPVTNVSTMWLSGSSFGQSMRSSNQDLNCWTLLV